MRTFSAGLMRALVTSAALIAFSGSIQPLPAPLRAELVAAHLWHPGCPVALSQLRLLTVSYRGFDGHTHTGQLVVDATAAGPLLTVFRRLLQSGTSRSLADAAARLLLGRHRGI